MDTPKTILVVEDEPALLEAVKLKLEKEGIEVWTAVNGDEALLILSQKRPTLVWLDVLMPGKNGLEVLETVRATPMLKELPIVIVSVSGSPEKMQQAHDLGVTDYIIKSNYTIDEIVNKMIGIANRV